MKLTDENGIPTVAGANMMFAAMDEARVNREWRKAELARQPTVTFADCLPWLSAAVEWARRGHYAQGLAVNDAAFVRHAPYQEPAARQHHLEVFETMRRSTELPDETRRFYAFLGACLSLAHLEK